MRNPSSRSAVSNGFLAAIALIASSTSSSAIDLEHPLFRAARERDDARVAALLRQGTPGSLRAEDGTTALMVAALWGTPRSVERLLAHGADPLAVNRSGATALLWGAGSLAKVRLLIQAGADVNARSALGNTPLIAAASQPGNHEVVALLIERGADIDARNERNDAALGRAIWSEDLASVQLLLERHAESGGLASWEPGAWQGLIRAAAERGHVEILELLRSRAPDPEVFKPGRALQDALVAQQLDAARWLLEHGADVNERIPAGKVPTLHFAAYLELDDPSIAADLIERGADPNGTNDRGETALTWARRRGHSRLIETLVDAGVPEHGDTPPAIPQREIDREHRDDEIRAAVIASVARMQSSSDTFLEKRQSCVSCHHQNLPGVAIAHARDRGFVIDRASVDRMIERQVADWAPRLARAHEMDRAVPVLPRFLGWGLWSFAALGYSQDLLTDSFVRRLAVEQRTDGRWSTGMTRPPMGGGPMLSTALAIRALRDYPTRGHEAELDARVERAVAWLRSTDPETHQERVFRLLALAWAGESPDTLGSLAGELLSLQRDDGGWSQLPGLASDAWATGESLVALHAAGHPGVDDPRFDRGIDFLLRTRFDDGSWFVQARAWPFQAPFESGFPHGHDQWISVGATAWAVMALVLKVTPTPAIVPARDELISPHPGSRRPATTNAASTPAEKRDATETLEVDFDRDVAAVLARSCVGCHGGDRPKAGLSLTTRRSLLEGGESGQPAIVSGDSASSPLVVLASDAREKLEMPPLTKRDRYPGLSDEELAKIRAWIDRGAVWPDGAVVTRKVE